MQQLLLGDSLTTLKTLPDQSVQTCVTSPPYWGLRDYGVDGQIGLEETPERYLERMLDVFREVHRVLRDDGTLWLNLGDSYWSSGSGDNAPRDRLYNAEVSIRCSPKGGRHVVLKPKDLVGVPWRVAFALQADGWYLRQDIIWHKPSVLPESVKDRCTKAHEYIFLLSKSKRYYFDADAIKEPLRTNPQKIKADIEAAQIKRRHKTLKDKRVKTLDVLVENTEAYAPTARNKRSVWTVANKPYQGAHFATFPPELIRPCILAGAPTQYTVLDPFMGSGTTGYVARLLQRGFIGIELNPEYLTFAEERIGALDRYDDDSKGKIVGLHNRKEVT